MHGPPRRQGRRGWSPTGLALVASLALIASLTLGLGAGCAAVGDAAAGDAALTVFAAASLRDLLAVLEPRWEAAHPRAGLTIAYDGSNILAAQIREGAPADVFVSADTERPATLAEAGFTAAQPVPFARNSISLVVPMEGSRLTSAADLAEPGIRVVAAAPDVPVSAYAELALAQLAAQTPDPEGFLAGVAANVVSREDNVRAALAKVELGEADAAFVYTTDARSSGLVREIRLPQGVAVTAEYAAVQVTDRPVAAEFVEWLRGAEVARALADAGFEPAVR